MARAFLIVLDSAGIGGAPDAHRFFNGDTPDTGANTIGHIAAATRLHLPNLDRLGLGRALTLASGIEAPEFGLGQVAEADPQGLWGAATEISNGKDTPSGHWEIAGVPVPFDWHYFPKTVPAFPPDVLAEIAEQAGTGGSLCNAHASGTAVIEAFGEEHLKTGWPICYTSVDSVLQIAAHEDQFGLDRLLTLCKALTPKLHAMRVGRVIARPFVGTPGAFKRTTNRKDFAVPPPAPTLCDWVQASGGRVHAVGKIGDIFSMQGIDDVATGTDADLMEHLIHLTQTAEPASLTFANFVEFDSLYGHRRDIEGYARHLEWFDAHLPRLFAALGPGDLMLFTADHGNDPSWTGTDHTRERVPVLGWGKGARAIGSVGFADIAASVAAHLGVANQGPGQSFL